MAKNIQEGDRVEIVLIGKKDGFYSARKELIGKIGIVSNLDSMDAGNFISCNIDIDNEEPCQYWYFLSIKIKKATE